MAMTQRIKYSKYSLNFNLIIIYLKYKSNNK